MSEKDSIFATDCAYSARMNDTDLNRMLQRAATTAPAVPPPALEDEVMARVRVDDGRAKRWRSFVLWVLALAAVSGVVTAGVIGWSKALHDPTHSTPPKMKLFLEGPPQ
jgi:type VI protein secretion system component VasF